MGKAVPRLIKQRAKKLLEAYPEELSTDFEKNKKFFKSLELPFSKTEINLISGFVVRLKSVPVD